MIQYTTADLTKLVVRGLSHLTIAEVLRNARDVESTGIRIPLQEGEYISADRSVTTYELFSPKPRYTFGRVFVEKEGGTSIIFAQNFHGFFPITHRGYKIQVRPIKNPAKIYDDNHHSKKSQN